MTIGEKIPGNFVDAIPGTTYRARILLSGTGNLASNGQVATEFGKFGFTNVRVFDIDEAPADWPSDEKGDEGGLFSKTRLVEGTWSGPAQRFRTDGDSRVAFLSKWIHAEPGANAPPPKVTEVVDSGPPRPKSASSSTGKVILATFGLGMLLAFLRKRAS